jgi:hypothetical protein
MVGTYSSSRVLLRQDEHIWIVGFKVLANGGRACSTAASDVQGENGRRWLGNRRIEVRHVNPHWVAGESLRARATSMMKLTQRVVGVETLLYHEVQTVFPRDLARD